MLASFATLPEQPIRHVFGGLRPPEDRALQMSNKDDGPSTGPTFVGISPAPPSIQLPPNYSMSIVVPMSLVPLGDSSTFADPFTMRRKGERRGRPKGLMGSHWYRRQMREQRQAGAFAATSGDPPDDSGNKSNESNKRTPAAHRCFCACGL